MDTVTDWLLVILIILSVYRATRLIIEDSFPPIAVPREWILNWWAPDDDWVLKKDPRNRGEYLHPNAKPHWGALGRSLRYLFTCPWCMSIWIGGIGIWITDAFFIAVPVPIFVCLAASAVTGLLSSLEEKLS